MNVFGDTLTKTNIKGWNFNENNSEEERKYAVIFHNDRDTDVMYVILVLILFFEKTIEQSEALIDYIEENGTGIAGIYDIDTAYEKLDMVEEFNKIHGQKLILTVKEA